jgi:RecB family exonuclease
MGDPLRSAPITSLYPTQYEWLRRCPLHVALDQQSRAGGGHRRRSDAQRLGDVIHAVMRQVVEEGRLADDDWVSRVETAWEAAIAAYEATDPDPSEPAKRWANYEEKRQRTLRLAERIRELILVHGQEGFLAERLLEARGGRLKGIADLIVRTPTLHAVIDYKTGAVAADDGAPMKAGYERQLRLYACLEAEVSGSWPGELAIYPLKGPVVALEASQPACEQAAEDALDALVAYNASAPGPQEARPGQETCPQCDFAPSCEAFWASTPMDGVATASGVVKEVFLAERGSISLVVDQPDGVRIEVLAILPAFHPAAASIKPGDTVRFIGIEEKGEPGYYRLPPKGMLGLL